MPSSLAVGRFQADFNRTIAAWARRAYATASTWPENLRDAPPPIEFLEEIAADTDHADVDTPPPGYDQSRS